MELILALRRRRSAADARERELSVKRPIVGKEAR